MLGILADLFYEPMFIDILDILAVSDLDINELTLLWPHRNLKPYLEDLLDMRVINMVDDRYSLDTEIGEKIRELITTAGRVLTGD